MAHPKPIEQHIALSTNGKTLGGRQLEVVDTSKMVAPKAPPMPDGLAERGQTEWLKVWQAGKWLWADQDYHWVEMIARAYDDIEQFRAKVNEEGLTVTGYNGQTVAHPLIAEIRKAEQSITRALSTIGFSPKDRAALKLAEVQGAKGLNDLLNSPQTSKNEPESRYNYQDGAW